MELHSLVWFNGGESYPLPGKIVEVTENGVIVLSIISNKKTSIADPKADLRVRHDNIEIETLDDLIVLKDLHEGSILYNLWARYNKGLIYTYTGSILIAINPYQLLDIYGLDTVKKYHGQPLGYLPPHLFAIGSAAHERMVNHAQDQCIIISGESGAGKTESTKLIMQYLAVVSKGPKTSHITEQILEANPLLESFGNAKTTKNDNSSRFGKYTEVFFSGGSIIGARITDYLLEKSRIAHQAPGERNYHVFYEMLVGMSPAEKAKYGLLAATGYNYLNQGGSHSNDLRSDAEEFQKLDRSLDVLSFKTAEKRTIFSILAAILHLGNVDFRLEELEYGVKETLFSILAAFLHLGNAAFRLEEVDVLGTCYRFFCESPVADRSEGFNAQEKLTISNQQQLEWAAKLLSLSSSDLEKALIYKVTATATERILTERSIEQAIEARDGIAKSLYTCLFAWLVSKINSTIFRDTKHTSIAILDIYGFEVFPLNSFEQLCINHANEYLQFFFNRHIFQMEQQEYQKEKIEWSTIEYANNRPTLDLMTKRPNGIFHLLDDESNFPQGSDKAFLDKCHYHHTGHPSYSHPKTTPMCFVLVHYAGKVTYDVDKFVEKNRDVLKSTMISMFQGSGSEIVSGMFHSLQAQEARRSSVNPEKSFAPKKFRSPTVATKFCESLDDLLSSMNRCNPYFVRCIKPNEDKSPLTFDMESVIEQLRYSGMMETIRIRKAGFPIRIPFKRFAERYRFLAQSVSFKKSPKDSALSILAQLDPKLKPEYRVGITKIFLKEYFENYLERRRTAIISKSVVVIQTYVRGYLARRRYRQLLRTILGLQAHIRGRAVRRQTQSMVVGVTYFQARVRGFLQRRRYAKMLAQRRHQRQMQRLREADLARQREAEEAARARMSAVILMRELDEESPPAPVTPTTFDPVAIGNLEIPHPLHVLLMDAEEKPLWYNEEKHVVKVPGAIPETKSAATLPTNIEDYPFSKYISIHFKTEDFGYSPSPLKTSLHKLGPEEEQRALALNKLILRFIHDVDQPSKALPEDKVFIVGSYIAQQCITNPTLRDEVYCQLCSLSWCNPSDVVNKRVWVLLSNLLAVCPPSTTMKNYLLKYISDHAFDGYKSYCQHKLLSIDPYSLEFGDSRSYPATLLEWKAHQEAGRMTLATWFNDRQMLNHEVHSWITGNDFAKALLQQRGVTNNNDGWSIGMREDGVHCELSGSDYVLDLIGEVEMPPKMGSLDPSFLVSSENVREIRSRRTAPMKDATLAVPVISSLPPHRSSTEVPPVLSAGPSNEGLYPANYPKPDYEIEQYQADRLRRRNAEGEPIYTKVKKKKDRPLSLVIESQPHSAEDEYVDNLFGDIGSNEESFGLDSPDMLNHALRGGGGGDTPSMQPGSSFYQPMGPVPPQPMYAPAMYPQQPTFMPVPQPTYMPMQQQMHAGMVPMMPQPAPAPNMQQMQMQLQLQNLQQQMQQLQASGGGGGVPTGGAQRSPPPHPRVQRPPQQQFDQTATIRKMEEEIDNLKKQQAKLTEQQAKEEPKGRPKGALKWPDNWEGERPRSIQFQDDVQIIPSGQDEGDRRSAIMRRRETPAVLPSYNGDKVQLPEAGGVPPPPPPPPLDPARPKAPPMVLRTKKGTTITVGEDRGNRAGTIRVGAVVWPPRATERRKEETIPGSEIRKTTKGAKDHSVGKIEIQAAELAQGAKNLKPTQTREAPKKVGQVTDKPAVIAARAPVAKKKPPPAPPRRVSPLKKGEDEVDHHADALKLLLANRLLQQQQSPPQEPVKRDVKRVVPPPPAPPPAPSPILKPQQPAPPPLPARDPGMQRSMGSAVLQAQAALGEKTEQRKALVATTTVASVHVKRLKDCEDVETRMFKRPQGDYYGYHRVPWTIQVRKEVFIPGETIGSDQLVMELIFRQIVIDTSSNSCIRMTKAEKRMMRSLLVEGDISELNVTSKMSYAPRVIEQARQLSFYFARFFPVVSGSSNLKVDYIGVSHHSIVLVQRSTNPTEDQLRAIETYEYSEVKEVKATTQGNLRIVTMSNNVVPLYTRRAIQLKNMIDGYITFSRADSRYVKALRDYAPNESSLLTFHAGDIIRIRENEVIKDNADWLFGVLSGKTGFFPSQLVEPLSGQSAPSPPSTPYATKVQRDLDIPGRLSMEEFAMKHFREIPETASLRRKRQRTPKKGRKDSLNSSILMEYKGLVSYSGSPIIVSLLPLQPDDNQRAKECFVALMQIMGDHPYMKRNSESSPEKAMSRAVLLILKTVREQQSLVDEIYCHIVKQTTHNYSQDSQSCLRGWRVLYLFTMYARCSDNLKPYLSHHLEDCSTVEAENKYSAMAKSCLLNLKKTFRCGGRENLPTREEITNLVKNGRLHKQHQFLIPASNVKSIRVKGNTLVSDAIVQLCTEMNLVHDSDVQEFGVLLITINNNEREQGLLDKESYLMDAITKGNQTFILVRTHWRRKLKIENQFLLSLLFNQVKQDYLQNRMILLSDEGLNPTLKEMIAYLGAILLRAQNMNQVPSLRDLTSLLPSMVFSEAVSQASITPQQWLNMIQQRVDASTSKITPNKAMMQFLHLTEKAKLHGSAFFEIKSSTNQAFRAGRCVMAVNKNGIHFFDTERYVLLFSYHLDEVISATPFTTEDGQNVLKINSGSLQDLQGGQYELEKTEQAALLIQDYLQYRRGQPVHSIDDEAMLSMANRRAAVEEAISKPATRPPPVPNGYPTPTYESSIPVLDRPPPDGRGNSPQQASPPVARNESLPNRPPPHANGLPNGHREPTYETSIPVIERPPSNGRQQPGAFPGGGHRNGHIPNGPPQATPTHYGRSNSQQSPRPAQLPSSRNILDRGASKKRGYKL